VQQQQDPLAAAATAAAQVDGKRFQTQRSITVIDEVSST
jgi:hypothetical protein